MRIRIYRNSDRPAWDDYVKAHPKGTFFHLIGWKEVIEKSFGLTSCYLVAESTQIVGLFPLFRVKSLLFGRPMVSTAFAPYGGILADDRSIETALYDEAVNLKKKMNLDYLEIRNENDSYDVLSVKDLYYPSSCIKNIVFEY